MKFLLFFISILGCSIFFTQGAFAVRTDLPTPVTKKVMVVNFNPILENHGNLRLTQYKGWEDPLVSEARYTADILSSSGGVVNYQIVERFDVDDIPVKQDGYDYTDETILACLANTATCHMPDGANLLKIIQDYQACEKRNTGVIDEVWIWGGPYFGYPESFSTGPNAYPINGPIIFGTTCAKLMPMMGFSYERSFEMLHNLGHRTEATMSHVYGGWQENRTDHNWDRFGLVKGQSPDYSYSGCGSIHWAPNSAAAYDYANGANATNSTCEDFLNYPNLTGVTTSMTCSPWNCNSYDYYKWWFGHLPRYIGIAADGKWNNWWWYVVDYETAANPYKWLFASYTAQINTSPPMDAKVNMLDAGYVIRWRSF